MAYAPRPYEDDLATFMREQRQRIRDKWRALGARRQRAAVARMEMALDAEGSGGAMGRKKPCLDDYDGMREEAALPLSQWRMTNY